MEERIICAGFGGQGVMAFGKLLTYAGMIEDKKVSWLPSYGPEMRGGTANCHVIVSDGDIGSPVITEATVVVAMNRPSLEKFEKTLVPGGKLFINSSLIEIKPQRSDVQVYYIPANEIAGQLENIKVANMVMLGAFLQTSKTVAEKDVIEAFKKVFGESKAKLIPINEQALQKGSEAVKQAS